VEVGKRRDGSGNSRGSPPERIAPFTLTATDELRLELVLRSRRRGLGSREAAFELLSRHQDAELSGAWDVGSERHVEIRRDEKAIGEEASPERREGSPRGNP
jgi:hypothetical protein